MNKQQIVMVALALLGFAVVVAFALTQFAKEGVSNRQQAEPETPVANADDVELETEAENAAFVYFGRDDGAPGEVYPREREAEDENDFIFAMEELMSGPTTEEREEGYVTELRFSPEEESVCEGRNFSIVVESGVFVVWVCRNIENSEDQDSQMLAQNQIRSTMEQFDIVEDLVVLGPERDCFDRGERNLCHDRLPAGVAP